MARSDRDVLWFGTGTAMRYYLTDGSGLGTCYLAQDPLIALVEVLGGLALVPQSLLDGRDLATIALAGPKRLADLTSNRAAGYGLTAEIHTSLDAALTQAWATALQAAGFQGVRGWARHDLTHRHPTVTLFDAAGSAHAGYEVVRREPLGGQRDLLKRLSTSYNIRVVPMP